MIGRRAGVALAALLALAGCREGPAPTRPLVVTTIFPLWDLTRHVAGDRAEARALPTDRAAVLPTLKTTDFRRTVLLEDGIPPTTAVEGDTTPSAAAIRAV